MIARRALFKIASGTLVGGALLLPRASAPAEHSVSSDHEINPREPRFGASGDLSSDDTRALQAAADYCFGAPSAPHGTADVSSNKVLRIPQGNYKITSPIRLAKLHGGRIIGSGRFVTKITNDAGDPVFVTNGCGYSHFEGMCLESSGKTATVFDLNWDGTAGGAALQSNTFADMFFNGGATGLRIGAGGFMGSENLILNCFFNNHTRAGLSTENGNALQQTIMGGNFQTCGTGILVDLGSVNVYSVGFQQSVSYDVAIGTNSNNAIRVDGCRTESPNFIRLSGGSSLDVSACRQDSALGSGGQFVNWLSGTGSIRSCGSSTGQISAEQDARLEIASCIFNRADWMNASNLWPQKGLPVPAVIDIARVLANGNMITRRRITGDGAGNPVVQDFSN